MLTVLGLTDIYMYMHVQSNFSVLDVYLIQLVCIVYSRVTFYFFSVLLLVFSSYYLCLHLIANKLDYNSETMRDRANIFINH